MLIVLLLWLSGQCGTRHRCPGLLRPMPWPCLVPKVSVWCRQDFSILLQEADGLFGCWYLSAFDRPPDNVIHLMMTLVPGVTPSPSAAVAMKSTCIHCHALPHGQVCGSQALHPSLWATATLTASSDSLRPTEAMGGACSQSPEWGDAAAYSLA